MLLVFYFFKVIWKKTWFFKMKTVSLPNRLLIYEKKENTFIGNIFYRTSS